jgi:hypothetical protein
MNLVLSAASAAMIGAVTTWLSMMMEVPTAMLAASMCTRNSTNRKE